MNVLLYTSTHLMSKMRSLGGGGGRGGRFKSGGIDWIDSAAEAEEGKRIGVEIETEGKTRGGGRVAEEEMGKEGLGW